MHDKIKIQYTLLKKSILILLLWHYFLVYAANYHILLKNIKLENVI